LWLFFIFPKIQWTRVERCSSTEFGVHTFSKCFLFCGLLSSHITHKMSIAKLITLQIPHCLKSSVHFLFIFLVTCSTLEFWYFVGTVFSVMYQAFKTKFKVVSWWCVQHLCIFLCHPWKTNIWLPPHRSPPFYLGLYSYLAALYTVLKLFKILKRKMKKTHSSWNRSFYNWYAEDIKLSQFSKCAII
jgi:hypothetical protein